MFSYLKKKKIPYKIFALYQYSIPIYIKLFYIFISSIIIIINIHIGSINHLYKLRK